MSAYSEKLKDPRWQKRRLQVFERDQWKCRLCHHIDRPLHVHHRWYEGEPWDAPDEALVTLCEDCHAIEGEYRKVLEARLIETLKRRFFVWDLVSLIEMVESMPRVRCPEGVGSEIGEFCGVVVCRPELLDPAKKVVKEAVFGGEHG